MIYRRKDLDILNLGEKSVVIACDSCGGIGEKENDFYKVPPFYVGALTARVVLFEILSTKAEIISISNAVCNEMDNTGKSIWEGVRQELKKACIKDTIITGSTEENMPTTMTAVGMTGLGIVDTDGMLFNKGKSGDFLVLYGTPKVGPELDLETEDGIVKYKDIYDLLEFEGTLELSATGSKGILHECEELAKINQLELSDLDEGGIDLKKSCGVSTCLVALIKADYLEKLPKTSTPIKVLGKLC